MQIVISREIFDGYNRVGMAVAEQFPRIDLPPILGLIAATAITVSPRKLPQQVCRDLDDDKFLASLLPARGNTSSAATKHYWQLPATPASRC